MFSRIGERAASAFRNAAPDPFVLAALLTALTFLLAVGHNGFTASAAGDAARAWADGLWGLLGFAMQMCLVLVTGHAMASSPPVARALRAVANLPRSPRQAVWLTATVAIACSLLNWGLGLIVGSILARDVARAMRARGLHTSPALLAAAGYTCMLTWHGGLSGSAPLKAASLKDQTETLGPELAAAVGAIPASETIFSTMNLVVTGALLVIVPLFMAALCPRTPLARDADPAAAALTDERAEPLRARPTPHTGAASGLARAINHGPLAAWLIGLPALAWTVAHFARGGALTFDVINLLFLGVGLTLHASPARYVAAVEDAARGCAGIILQFPLYAGIIGIMDKSGLAAAVSQWFVRISGDSEPMLAMSTFLSAGLVNVFVPSGGGQWAVQGPIAMQAALDAGASPARLVMAVAYGDQWTNMIQFFWALPLTGVTGVRAQDALGYTALTLVLTGPLFAAALALL